MAELVYFVDEVGRGKGIKWGRLCYGAADNFTVTPGSGPAPRNAGFLFMSAMTRNHTKDSENAGESPENKLWQVIVLP